MSKPSNFNVLEVSETGRAIRSDSLESKYGIGFLRELIIKYYVNEKLSSTEASDIIRSEHNIPITADKFLKLSKKLGIVRSKSEAISLQKRSLSYDSIINENLKSIIDGLLMGDGSVTVDENTKVGRLSLGSVHKEFAQYCSGLLKEYGASEPHFSPGKKGRGIWEIRTLSHPDFYNQRLRWYPGGKKDVPSDIVFDRTFMTLWYLGDGCLSGGVEKDNSRYLYFSTNCFSRDALERIVLPKFREIGVNTKEITKKNCVHIASNSFWALLKFMGGESPVKCFDYKFDLEDWRKLPGMHEVSELLNISYQKLSYWVKVGAIEHSRSPGGKKVVFTNEEIEALKNRLDNGELPREEGKHARREVVGIGLSGSILALGKIRGESFKATDFVINVLKNKSGNDLSQSLRCKEMTQVNDESENDFFKRVVETYQRAGFPYPIIDENRKLKLWQGLWKTMSPEFTDEIIWRSSGNILATSYHPHIYSLNIKGDPSPMDVYKNREFFIEAIKNYKSMGGRLTYGGVLDALCRFRGSRKLNNYSPLIARDIINHYGFEKMKVIDPCAGFGGRLIGASVSRTNCSYVGIEPSSKTVSGLYETQKFLLEANPNFSSTIIQDCAEDALKNIRDEVYDLCFTCPPYFDIEIYSKEENQSINKYPTYDLWIEGFLRVILREVCRIIKRESKSIFQIGNVPKQDFKDDFIRVASECGLSLYRIHPVIFQAYPHDGKGAFQERLLVFSKP